MTWPSVPTCGTRLSAAEEKRKMGKGREGCWAARVGEGVGPRLGLVRPGRPFLLFFLIFSFSKTDLKNNNKHVQNFLKKWRKYFLRSLSKIGYFDT